MTIYIFGVVPALSFTGVLSTLALTVDLSEYILLRGLLMFNVGECLDDLFAQDEDMASVFNQVCKILAGCFEKFKNISVFFVVVSRL